MDGDPVLRPEQQAWPVLCQFPRTPLALTVLALRVPEPGAAPQSVLPWHLGPGCPRSVLVRCCAEQPSPWVCLVVSHDEIEAFLCTWRAGEAKLTQVPTWLTGAFPGLSPAMSPAFAL